MTFIYLAERFVYCYECKSMKIFEDEVSKSLKYIDEEDGTTSEVILYGCNIHPFSTRVSYAGYWRFVN